MQNHLVIGSYTRGQERILRYNVEKNKRHIRQHGGTASVNIFLRCYLGDNVEITLQANWMGFLSWTSGNKWL